MRFPCRGPALAALALLSSTSLRAEGEPTDEQPAACVTEDQLSVGRRYAVVTYQQDVAGFCAAKENQPDPAAALSKRITDAIKTCTDTWKKRGKTFKTKIFPVFVVDRFKSDPAASESIWGSLCEKGFREAVPGLSQMDWLSEALEDLLIDDARYYFFKNRETFARKVLKQLGENDELTPADVKNVDPPEDIDAFLALETKSDGTGDFKNEELAKDVKQRQDQLKKVKAGLVAAVAKSSTPAGMPVSSDTVKKVGDLGANFGGAAGCAAFDAANPGKCAPGSPGGGVGIGTTGGVAGTATDTGGTGGGQPDLSKKPPNKDWPQTPDEKAVSEGLSKRYQGLFADNKYGQELQAMMKKDGVDYPPIVIRTAKLSDGSPDTKAMAYYDMESKSITINAYQIRKAYPDTAGMTDAQIQKWMADPAHPERMDDLAKNTQGVMYHETMHSYQGGYCPLHGYYAGAKGNVMEQETQAYGSEMRYSTEMIKKNPSLLTSKNPFMKNEVDNTFAYTMNPDKWRTGIMETYNKAYGANMTTLDKADASLDQKIANEKKKCGCDDNDELKKLRDSRDKYKKADDFYKEQADKEKKDYTQNLQARTDYLVAIGKSYLNTNPLVSLGSYSNVKVLACQGSNDDWWQKNWASPFCDNYTDATLMLDKVLRAKGIKLNSGAETQIVGQFTDCKSAAPLPKCPAAKPAKS